MISPLQTYKNQKNKEELRKDGFTFFNDKYFKDPWKEYDFLETEERYDVRKMKTFIPGRIYTFQYDPLYKDFLDYYDKRPMIIAHGIFVAKTTGNIILQGINLNFLPELARVQTLELFYQTFKSDLNEADDLVNKGRIGLLKQAWKYLTDWFFMIKIFNGVGKIGYQWAFRNYIIPRIKNPVIVELEDWERVPYFIPKEFNGATPGEVWKAYLKLRPDLAKQILKDEKKSKDIQKKYKKP